MTTPIGSGKPGADVHLADYQMGLQDAKIKRSRREEIPPSITYEGYDTATGLIRVKQVGAETVFYSKQIFNSAVKPGDLLNPRPGTNGGLPRADSLSVRRQSTKYESKPKPADPLLFVVYVRFTPYFDYSLAPSRHQLITDGKFLENAPLPYEEVSYDDGNLAVCYKVTKEGSFIDFNFRDMTLPFIVDITVEVEIWANNPNVLALRGVNRLLYTREGQISLGNPSTRVLLFEPQVNGLFRAEMVLLTLTAAPDASFYNDHFECSICYTPSTTEIVDSTITIAPNTLYLANVCSQTGCLTF